MSSSATKKIESATTESATNESASFTTKSASVKMNLTRTSSGLLNSTRDLIGNSAVKGSELALKGAVKGSELAVKGVAKGSELALKSAEMSADLMHKGAEKAVELVIHPQQVMSEVSDGLKKEPKNAKGPQYVELVMHGNKASAEGEAVHGNFLTGIQIENLLKDDQLKKEMKKQNVFQGGWEALIPKFPPTFKVEKKKGYCYKDKRIPSYCDRILHTSLPTFKENLKVIDFFAAEDAMTSDHKPVGAVFEINILPATAEEFSMVNEAEDVEIDYNITLSKFKGKDLVAADLTTSDPYIIMYSIPEVFKPCKSKYKNKTLTPEWSEIDMKKLKGVSMTVGKDRILNNTILDDVNIVLSIVDYDFGRRDDVIGQIILPIKARLQNSTKIVLTDEPVILYGQPAGFLSGEIEVLKTQRKRGLTRRESSKIRNVRKWCAKTTGSSGFFSGKKSTENKGKDGDAVV